jgi:hypothetical protein
MRHGGRTRRARRHQAPVDNHEEWASSISTPGTSVKWRAVQPVAASGKNPLGRPPRRARRSPRRRRVTSVGGRGRPRPQSAVRGNKAPPRPGSNQSLSSTARIDRHRVRSAGSTQAAGAFAAARRCRRDRLVRHDWQLAQRDSSAHSSRAQGSEDPLPSRGHGTTEAERPQLRSVWHIGAEDKP